MAAERTGHTPRRAPERYRSGTHRPTHRLAFLVVAATLVAAACTPATGTLGPGPWTWTEVRVEPPERSQGLATDPSETAPSDTWYSSQFTVERAGPDGSSLGINGSLPLDVVAQLLVSHTGDVDADGGRLIVPWENKQFGPSDPPAKAFGVYDENTLQLEGWAKHVLVPGESNDNPWVTVSPDGRWMVSGPYAPLDRLQVFPVPAAPYADLPLTAEIPLDVPAQQVQGCDFVDDTELVCESNDGPTGKQVFTLDLDAPVGHGASIAHLTEQGPAPQAAPLVPALGSSCADSGEVEGIDAQRVAGGTMVRILVVDRCYVVTHEYEHLIPG